jgi:hypothetical protein
MRRQRRCLSWLRPCPPALHPSDPPHPAAGTPTPHPATQGQGVKSEHSQRALRIRNIYPGSEFFPFRIPDPNRFHPKSRIRIKEFKYFNTIKIISKLSEYDPGCLYRTRNRICHPSRIIGSKKHRNSDPDPQHCS